MLGSNRFALPACALMLAGALLAQSGDDKGGGSGKGGSSGFKFYGAIQSMPANLIGNWLVGGRTVIVSSSTLVVQTNGSLGVGVCAEVEGAPQSDNSIVASSISRESSDKCIGTGNTVSELKFFGGVERMPATGRVGAWVVAGKTVNVTSGTDFRQEGGPVAMGACVEVEGPQAADGSITAAKFEVKSGSSGCSSGDSSGRGGSSSSFYGVIQFLPATTNGGDWIVSGRTVHFTTATEFRSDRPAAVGACVSVDGAVERDGSITATRIRIEQEACQSNARLSDTLKFYGLVQSVASGAGNWQIGGKTVRVSASTELEQEWGPLAVNACASVRGQVQADGSILASHIESEPASDCGSAGSPGSSSGEFEMYGVIENWPAPRAAGNWTISGKTVQVASTTVLEFEHGAMSIGSCVEVHGNLLASGAVAATKIEVVSGSGTCVFRGGVTNAASYSAVRVAPGMLVSVFGVNLGPATKLDFRIVDDKFARDLGNVRVLFDGVEAPLLMVSPGQINAVVPYSVNGKSQVMVQIEHNSAWSNPQAIQVSKAAPAIFTQSMSGKGPGAILNVDDRGGRSVNGADNPIRRGSYIEIYGTGEGMTTSPDDGRVAPAGCTSRPLLPVRVVLGDRELEAAYGGCAPGLVQGVFQVNVRIPDDAPVGPNVPIYLKVGDDRSRDGVTVAIDR